MESGRRSGRNKKVSQRLGVVTDKDQRQAATARLEALEDDDNVLEEPGAGSDDEFVLEDSDEGRWPLTTIQDRSLIAIPAIMYCAVKYAFILQI